MFSVEAFENSLYEETGDPGGNGMNCSSAEVWEWSTAAVPRKPLGAFGILPDTTGSTYSDVVYPWLVSNATDISNVVQSSSSKPALSGEPPNILMVDPSPSASSAIKPPPGCVSSYSIVQYPEADIMQLSDLSNLTEGHQMMGSPMLSVRGLAAVKKIGYKSNCSAKRGGGGTSSSLRKTSLKQQWSSSVCACGSSSTAGCICGQNNGAMDYYGTAMCDCNGICTGLCSASSMLPNNSPLLDSVSGACGGASASPSESTSLNRFTLQDENGKRKIRNDIMSIAESLPSLPGLYFDKKQKGFRVRYQNVYVGWVALSRFPSIEEAYCSARDIWENAKAHAEKFQTPQAAIIASLPLQKQAKASGKNRGGRPRTVTQLPPEWGPGSNGGANQNQQGQNGYVVDSSIPPQLSGGGRRMTSWTNNNSQLIPNSMTGELTAAPSPTDHWSHQHMQSADMMYPMGSKFNDLTIFTGGPTTGVLGGDSSSTEAAGYYLPSPISYGKPVVSDDLNFDSTPWS